MYSFNILGNNLFQLL